MRMNDAKLAAMAANAHQYPEDGLPEIAFVGRSNVGKSSLLNALLRRKNLAYTSSKPGKTRTFNFYRIDDAGYFVDLPGYGYAQADRATRKHWGRQMQEYLETREPLAAVVQLIDSRHDPMPSDREMFEFLCTLKRPIVICATKHDKLSANKWGQQKKAIQTAFGIEEDQLFPVSILKPSSVDDLREALQDLMKAYARDASDE